MQNDKNLSYLIVLKCKHSIFEGLLHIGTMLHYCIDNDEANHGRRNGCDFDAAAPFFMESNRQLFGKCSICQDRIKCGTILLRALCGRENLGRLGGLSDSTQIYSKGRRRTALVSKECLCRSSHRLSVVRRLLRFLGTGLPYVSQPCPVIEKESM